MTPWTVACQASLSMKIFRQEYWSRLSFPTPEDVPDRGVESTSPALAFLSLCHLGTPQEIVPSLNMKSCYLTIIRIDFLEVCVCLK